MNTKTRLGGVLSAGITISVGITSPATAQEWRVPPRYGELHVERGAFDALLADLGLSGDEVVEAHTVFADYEWRVEQLRSSWYHLTRAIDSMYPWVYDATNEPHERNLELDMTNADTAWVAEATRQEARLFELVADLAGPRADLAADALDDRRRGRWSEALKFGGTILVDGVAGTRIDLVGETVAFFGSGGVPDAVRTLLDGYRGRTDETLRALDDRYTHWFRARRLPQWGITDARMAGDAVALREACVTYAEFFLVPARMTWDVRHETLDAAEAIEQRLPPEDRWRFAARVDREVNPFLYRNRRTLEMRLDERLAGDGLSEVERRDVLSARRDLARIRDETGAGVVARYEAIIAPAQTASNLAYITRRLRELEPGDDPMAGPIDAFNEALAEWYGRRTAVASKFGLALDINEGPPAETIVAEELGRYPELFTAWIPAFPEHIPALAAGAADSRAILEELWREHVRAYVTSSSHFFDLQVRIEEVRTSDPVNAHAASMGNVTIFEAWRRDRLELELAFAANVEVVLDEPGRAAWRDMVRSARRARVPNEMDRVTSTRKIPDLVAVLEGLGLTAAERRAVAEQQEAYAASIDVVLGRFERASLALVPLVHAARGFEGDSRSLLEIDAPVLLFPTARNEEAEAKLVDEVKASQAFLHSETQRFMHAIAGELPPERGAAFRTASLSTIYPGIYLETAVDVVAPLLRGALEGRADELERIESILTDYASAREPLRRRQIAALEVWEEPDATEVARRAAIAARGSAPRIGERYTDANPIVPLLVARRALDASTCRRLGEALGAERLAALTPGTRLLLDWAE